MLKDSTRVRARWNERWQLNRGSGFCWHSPEAPVELRDLLDTTTIPTGGALDVGCGDGVVTWYLAQRMSPVVGLDIALPAVVQAMARPAPVGAKEPVFVVGDACSLPFAPGAFALVFDRGCMHNLARSAYPRYLQEVQRVLKPSGIFELFFAAGDAHVDSSGRGAVTSTRNRLSSRVGRGRPFQFSQSTLAELLPPAMEIVRVERSTFVSPKTGVSIGFTHCVLRRTPQVSPVRHEPQAVAGARR